VSVSKKLGLSPEWADVIVSEGNGAKLALPGHLVKAIRTAEEAERRRAFRERQKAEGGMGAFFSTTGGNLTSGNVGGGLEKPRWTISHAALRAASRALIIDRLIIDAIKLQARRFAQICDVPGKQKGFRVVHRRHDDPNFDSDTDDIRRRCAEMEELLRRPSKPPHADFRDFLMNAIEDQLVLDRRAMVKVRAKGGGIASYHLVDGATIQPRLQVLAEWMARNDLGDLDQAMLSIQGSLYKAPPRDGTTGVPRWINFNNAAWVQIVDGLIQDAWEEDEMEVAIANPSVAIDHWGYGYGPLENSIYLSFLFNKAMRYNNNLFDTDFPEAIIAVRGDYNAQGLQAFKRAIQEFDAGEGGLRLPIIDGDEIEMNVVPLRESPTDMQMVEMIVKIANLKCGYYGIHPGLINITEEGGQIQIGYGSDSAVEQAVGTGFHTYLLDQARFFDQAIVQPTYPDLTTIIEGLDTETEQARIGREQYEKTYMTYNEFRQARNMPPIAKGIPEEIGDFVADPLYFQAVQVLQAKQQMDQQTQQQSMGAYDQGDFGQGQQGGAPGGGPGAPSPGGDPEGAVQQGWQQAQQGKAGQDGGGAPQGPSPFAPPGGGGAPPGGAPPSGGGSPFGKSVTIRVEGDNLRELLGWSDREGVL
jgi:hypothetical protein